MKQDTQLPIFMRSLPFVQKDHGQQLLTALYTQQQSGYLCDLWLFIENEKFPTHKAVLAAFSPYFQSLFYSQIHESEFSHNDTNITEIHLSSVKKNTFLPILHFLYTSKLHLFKENIIDIWKTAKKLRINSIVEVCNKLIANKCILPSLNESKEENGARKGVREQGTKNNVLYIDLSDEEGDTNATKQLMPVNKVVESSSTEMELEHTEHDTDEVDKSQTTDSDENPQSVKTVMFKMNPFITTSTSDSSKASSSNSPDPTSRSSESGGNSFNGGHTCKELRKSKRISAKSNNKSPYDNHNTQKNPQTECRKWPKMSDYRQLLRSHLMNKHKLSTLPQRYRQTRSIDEIASLISQKNNQTSPRTSLNSSQMHNDLASPVQDENFDENSSLFSTQDSTSTCSENTITVIKVSSQQQHYSDQSSSSPPEIFSDRFEHLEEESPAPSSPQNNKVHIKTEPGSVLFQFSEALGNGASSDHKPQNGTSGDSSTTMSQKTLVNFSRTPSTSVEGTPKARPGFEKRVLLNAINKITDPVMQTALSK